MDARGSFRIPRLLLPRAGVDLAKWAVIACDQHTAEPDYWERVAATVGEAPSTLHMIFPEAYLGRPDVPERIARIQAAMVRYLDEGLLQPHDGAVYVERDLGDRVRRGLLLELDLEAYDFSRDSTSAIRPTEGTMVERLAPRIAVRRGAEVEVPHVLVLIDDPDDTVLGPLTAARAAMARLYDTALMEEGGRVAGFAVDEAQAARLVAALHGLAEPKAFARRYGVPEGTPPMLFAVGDGNHSLATARQCWEAIRAEAGPDHPARFALVEVETIHDAALNFEPIHRLLFGVTADLRAALRTAFGDRVSVAPVPDAQAMRRHVCVARAGSHAAGLLEPGGRFGVIAVRDPQSTLPVGTFQAFIDRFLQDGGAREVDYVHGDEALERLSAAEGCAGIQLPPVDKGGLLRMVVREGPLPRKAFSMGEAHEKRFYFEARRIGTPRP